ncbi:ORFx [Bat SARS-like coronavirus]|nr:ORFx [Bat SARS-like coronavirus]
MLLLVTLFGLASGCSLPLTVSCPRGLPFTLQINTTSVTVEWYRVSPASMQGLTKINTGSTIFDNNFSVVNNNLYFKQCFGGFFTARCYRQGKHDGAIVDNSQPVFVDARNYVPTTAPLVSSQGIVQPKSSNVLAIVLPIALVGICLFILLLWYLFSKQNKIYQQATQSV